MDATRQVMDTVRQAIDLDADAMLDVATAAKFLKLSRSKLYGMMDAGELQFAKFGKSRRIPKQALLKLVRDSLV